MDSAMSIYEEDLAIAKAIMRRDVKTTIRYMYEIYSPLFKAIFNQYYTDRQNCKEFIDEIYVIIMTSGVQSGYCPLHNFRGESSLMTWMQNASLSYCYNRFKKRINIIELPQSSDETGEENINFIKIAGSEMMDMTEIYRRNKKTVQKLVLRCMPNKRYCELLWLYMIEKKSHKEVAQAMGMTMPNYYSRRKLAKEQYENIRKEMKL